MKSEFSISSSKALLTVAVTAVLTLATLAFCVHLHIQLPILERAAYLQGRYDLDRDTAMLYARLESSSGSEVSK